MPRAFREGSIYRRESDGLWVASVRRANGRRRYAYGKTQGQAREKLKTLHQELGEGRIGKRIRVRELVDRWLEYKSMHLRPATLRRYSILLRNNVVNEIGDIWLGDLGPTDLSTLYSAKSKQWSAATVVQLHRVISGMLKQAVRWGYLSRNVATLVSPPTIRREEPKSLSLKQSRALMKAADGHPFEGAIWLGIQGMRVGEILALSWQDVDLEGELQVNELGEEDRVYSLRVRHSLRWDRSGWHLDVPKTLGSRRVIALTEGAVRALRRRQAYEAELRLVNGRRWQDNGLVFTNRIGGPIRSESLSAYHFKPLLRKAKIPEIKFHDLRHSAATLLLASGVPVADVSATIGHSSPYVTYTMYAHAIPGAGRRSAKALDRQLK